MGNIGSQSCQINGNREVGLRAELRAAKRYLAPELWVRSCPRTVKVLPELESRQTGLRHTSNGKILHSGGTLSGRHMSHLRNAHSSPYAPMQRFSFEKVGLTSNLYEDGSPQKLLDHQFKLCRSEPDLRFSSSVGPETQKKINKKKYRAPPPPTSATLLEKQSAKWDEHLCDENPLRRTRLFKTKFESKKKCNELNIAFEHSIDNNSDIVEEQIQVREKINCLGPRSLPEFNFTESNGLKMELIEATERLRATKVDAIESDRLFKSSLNVVQTEQLPNSDLLIERRYLREAPSGKESSTAEVSPILGATDAQKPRSFYFGMERDDSDASSIYPVEDDEQHSAIALRLRPVLPRKHTQIPRFSPAVAWRLLDARSQDSGISGDARSPLPSSWTPQQDLGDDSSIDDAIREEPRLVTKPHSHLFSLSLPRDHPPAAFINIITNKSGVSSLGRLKRSVSGVLNTLSNRGEQEKRAPSKEDDSNWFFTRSAPNSLNDNSPELPESIFPHNPSTARLMYLPETTIRISPVEDKPPLTVFSKSCEELQGSESLCDIVNMSWFKEERYKKAKKFTFQSTLRQIERKRMADKLSREAEKKEKQRLTELEVMRRVEEEFQKKRAKEKASIRQQLRLYAMDDQWNENINVKTEDRQEPDGALSSSNSSLSVSKCEEELRKNKHFNISIQAHVTKELSEYRQTQREYRESSKYVAAKQHFRQTTVHPGITYNMPSAKGVRLENDNYRKDVAYGMNSTKSISCLQSEEFQHNYFPKMYRHKHSPLTRF